MQGRPSDLLAVAPRLQVQEETLQLLGRGAQGQGIGDGAKAIQRRRGEHGR